MEFCGLGVDVFKGSRIDVFSFDREIVGVFVKSLGARRRHR